MNNKAIHRLVFAGALLTASSGLEAKDSLQTKDVAYKTVGKKSLLLDLYYPETVTGKKLPLVIYTHGGGRAAGSKDAAKRGDMQHVIQGLTKKRTDEISAPVEILIIKNAGHNWRMADGKTPIEPERNVIIRQTVEFLTKHLSNAGSALKRRDSR